MKKQLLALSLLATPGLMADYDDAGAKANSYSQGQCGTCCQTPCCCKPCCVPQPKKCIDCECYTPAYYDLQCDWGFSLSGDFLYWYARETNLAYSARVTATPVENAFTNDDQPVALDHNIISPTSTQYQNVNWKPGFRIGLGWNTDCDGWDAYLTWTYMRNTRSDSTSTDQFSDTDLFTGETVAIPGAGQQALINPWINAGLLFRETKLGTDLNYIPPMFTKISAKWKMQYNVIDLEFGRKYWLSRCFTLRPYGGLRGGWVKTTFNTTSTRDLSDLESIVGIADANYSVDVNFTNRFWGVGLIGGLQPNWHFCSNFILFSNLEGGLLWGEFERKRSENYSATVRAPETSTQPSALSTWSSSSSDRFYQMYPVLDFAIGFRWEENWCCDRYKTALDIGWEHHVWIDVNHREKTDRAYVVTDSTDPFTEATGVGGIDEATGNLGMGGLVIRLRVDF